MVVPHACTCTVLLLVSCICHQFKVWLKPAAEQQFLYGHNVLKSGLGRITEGTAQYQGVVVYSMGDMPLVSGQHWPVALGECSALTCCPVSLFSTDTFITLGECSALTYLLHWVSGQHWLVALGEWSALTYSLHWVSGQHWPVALGEWSALTCCPGWMFNTDLFIQTDIALGECSALTYCPRWMFNTDFYCPGWVISFDLFSYCPVQVLTLTCPGWVISTDLPWVSDQHLLALGEYLPVMWWCLFCGDTALANSPCFNYSRKKTIQNSYIFLKESWKLSFQPEHSCTVNREYCITVLAVWQHKSSLVASCINAYNSTLSTQPF